MKWTICIVRDREFYPEPEGTVKYLGEGHHEVVIFGAQPYWVEADSKEEAKYLGLSMFYQWRATRVKEEKEQEIQNYSRTVNGLSGATV
jgi:hypothetical protein